MGEKSFIDKISTALEEYKGSEDLQNYVQHNMSHYSSALINYAAIKQNELDFDFRNDYWWKTEVRFFLRFCMEYFDKNFVPPAKLRTELLAISNHLKESRSNGTLDKLPEVGFIGSKKELAAYGEVIASAMDSLVSKIGASDVVNHHKGLEDYKNLAAAFKDFCISFAHKNEIKGLDGNLKRRFQYMHFVTAKNENELESHAVFFTSVYGLFTKTNSYVWGGAQSFGPILGNSNFKEIIETYTKWKSGSSLTDAPFLAHNSASKNKVDHSSIMPVLEAYGYSHLDKFPIMNNVAMRYYETYLDIDNSQRLTAFESVAELIDSYYEDQVDDSVRTELEKLFDTHFESARNAFEMSVQPEFIKKQSLKGDYLDQTLTARLEKTYKVIAGKVRPPDNFDKAKAMLHLVIDSILYKDEKDKEAVADSNAPKNTNSNTRYWLYAPGESASEWDSFYRDGIMAIGWDKMGDLSEFSDRSEMEEQYDKEYSPENSAKNIKLCLWEFGNIIKPGDIVIAKKGFKALVGYGVVTSDYSFDPKQGQYPHCRSVDWKVSKEVPIPEEEGDLAWKTLTDVTKYKGYPQKLLAYLGVEPGDVEIESTTNQSATDTNETEADEFTLDQALRDLFLEKSDFEKMVSLLNYKKNIVLEGPPGVGKTFVAKRIAKAHMGFDDESKIEMVQFHQSYSYEDFVQGYRPDGNGGFVIKDGVFLQLCQKAKNDPDNPYYLVIDEINRGNISKIFGELLMLIESDKRGDSYKVSLTYSKTGEKFSVPKNLHIIGTMNTADRSLSIIDYALRRRFSFIRLKPQFTSPRFTEYLEDLGVETGTIQKIVNTMTNINNHIRGDKRRLGSGYEIGHSYFCPSEKGKYDEEWFNTVWFNEVLPVLSEYWFDDEDKLAEIKTNSAA